MERVQGAKGPTTHFVPLLLGNVQMSLAADDCLIESAQDLECVAQVPTGLGLPHAVTNGPGRQEGVRSQLGLAEPELSKNQRSLRGERLAVEISSTYTTVRHQHQICTSC